MERKRRILKEQLDKEKNKRKRLIIKKRREMLQNHIIKSKINEEKQRIKASTERIMAKGIFNGNAYWDYRKSLGGCNKIRGKSINNKNGEREDDPDRIKKVYKDFYEELLKTEKANDDEGKRIEESVDRCIETMKRKAEKIQIKPVTKEEYEEMKKNLKKHKAPDIQG